MGDVIQVSYTGDLLGHRRCPRAWAYEKQAGFHPYEQVQAMEGRLIHHAMEWLTRAFLESGQHPTADALREQLQRYFRVLWARGIRTTFASKKETIDRVVGNLFPDGQMHQTVRTAIEGAVHTEYELRSVKKLIKADFAGKNRLLLTGVLDLVIQQQNPLAYARTWQWTQQQRLLGVSSSEPTQASVGDVEIWDYKGVRSNTPYVADYVRQLLTYAALFKEKSGYLPQRCVLFFVNEKERAAQLLAVPVDEQIVDQALRWTMEQVKLIRKTTLDFQNSPLTIEGGGLDDRHKPVGERVSEELKQQCTACGFRFDCTEYGTHLQDANHSDISRSNVRKN
jgi:PD-(D/E)XK nuclease superfamily